MIANVRIGQRDTNLEKRDLTWVMKIHAPRTASLEPIQLHEQVDYVYSADIVVVNIRSRPNRAFFLPVDLTKAGVFTTSRL